MGKQVNLTELRLDISNLKRKLKEVETSMGGLEGKSKKTGSFMSSQFAKVGLAIGAAFAVERVAGFALEVGKLAGEAKGVEAAFNRLDRPDLLKRLREATQGTVSDLELMKQAIQAKNFKIPLDLFADGLDFATRRAQETGQSVEYLTQSLVIGLGRESVLILDNLGISALEIRDRMKEVGSFAEAAGQIIREELGKSGEVIDNASSASQRMAASFENAKVAIGGLVERLFLGSFNSLAGILDDITKMLGSVSDNTDDVSKSYTTALKAVEAVNGAWGSEQRSLRSLLNEYKDLTGSGIKPNAREKQRLSKIAQELSGRLGDSVVAINKETGALEVNIKAVEAAIKGKLLLANNEAVSISARILQTRDAISLTKLQIEEEKALNEARSQGNAVLEFTISQHGETITKSDLLTDSLEKQGNELQKLTNQLQSLGFSLDDVDRLFRSAEKKTKKKKEAVKELDKAVIDLTAAVIDLTANMKPLNQLMLIFSALNKTSTESAQRLFEAYRDGQITLEQFLFAMATIPGALDEFNRLASDTRKVIDKDFVKNMREAFDKTTQRNIEFTSQQVRDLQAELRRLDDTMSEGGFNFLAFQDKRVKAIEEEGKALERLAIQAGASYQEIAAIQAETERQIRELRQVNREDFLGSLEEVGNLYLQARSEQINTELNLLNEQRAKEQMSDERFQARKAKLLKEQADNEKRQALFTAIITSALNIIKAVGSAPFPANLPAIIFAAALGAAQIAFIAGASPPKFEKGGRVKGKRHKDGGTIIEAEVDEHVVARQPAIKYRKELDAMNNGRFEKMILDQYVAPLMAKKMEEMQVQRSMTSGKYPVYNDSNLRREVRKNRAVGITNVDQLADSIARKVNFNDYAKQRYGS